MQSQIHEIDPVTIELEVEVPWDRVQKGLAASFSKLQRTAKLKGFRPGKVPRSVVQKVFGKQVRAELVATLVEEGLLEAVQAHEIPIVASPQISSLPSIQDGEAMTFKARLEVRPKIETIALEGLTVERPSSEVKPSAVDEQIEQIRRTHAEIITPDPMRPARAGDLLTIDYTVTVDGEERPEMAAEGRAVELGDDRLLPEIEKGLIGASPEETVSVELEYGDDIQNEELRGKKAIFTISIKELRERVLPELDDELAKDAGEHETLAALRADIEKKLRDSAEEQAKSAVEQQLIEKLVELNPIPVPPSLIEQQEQELRRELSFFAQMSGQKLDESFFGPLTERAEHKVRAGLLLGEVARRQELSVEPEEIEAKFQEIAERTGKHIAKIRVEYAGERRDGLESELMQAKILDYLMSQATVTDAPAEDTSEAEG